MNTNELNVLIQKTLKEMEVKGYKEQTIKSEQCTFNCLLKYCKKNNILNYTDEIGFKFLEDHYHLSKLPDRSKCRRIRSIYLLKWISEGKDITVECIPRECTYYIPKGYQEIIDEYKSYLISNKYSNSTIRGKINTLTRLFCYSKDRKINDYSLITREVIYDFLNDVKDEYSLRSIYTITYRIKNFYDYLYDNNKSDFNGNDLFPKIIKQDKVTLPSYYTKDEIIKILSAVDTTTKIGKRDYAVLLLAVTYGLRNSDIINLSFDNIDWNHNLISIIQQKTKIRLELYLTEQVKLSLLDYIKNARPNVESNHIFLKFKFPYEYNFNNKTLYRCLSKYIKKANIDVNGRKRGLHSLRHSCANNLLSNNTQLPVITGIFGHSSTNTTKTYLSIDLNQLIKISLEVPDNE